MRKDIPTQAGVEDPTDDPYDFKEGDIEYSFPATKKLKGLSRDPIRKSKVGMRHLLKECTIMFSVQ